MTKTDILMTGVGGQGVNPGQRRAGGDRHESGLRRQEVRLSGMSQRGGSVVSHLRLGRQVFSPMIRKGEANVLLAFERLEGARWADYLNTGASRLSTTCHSAAFRGGRGICLSSAAEVEEMIRRYTDYLFIIPGTQIAQEMATPGAPMCTAGWFPVGVPGHR